MNTNLSNFLHTLFKQGEVLVAEEIRPFSNKEKTAAVLLLQIEYDRQKLSLPTNMPVFDEKAALWGTIFLYRSVQLTMMRDLEEAEVIKKLPKFTQEMTPETAYSVDLTFRYLPDLFKLAKGLAPDDMLVKMLYMQAQQFPFSSVGLSIETLENQTMVLNHSGLKLAYLDRVTAKKDLERVEKFGLVEEIKAILGDYIFDLWPALRSISTVTIS